MSELTLAALAADTGRTPEEVKQQCHDALARRNDRRTTMHQPCFQINSPLAEMTFDELARHNAEHRFWAKRDERYRPSFEEAVEEEMGGLRKRGGDQFVFDHIADPSGDLGRVADIAFQNWEDEAALGRLVKNLLRPYLHDAAKRAVEDRTQDIA